jgi:hypothetical protein
MISRTTMPVRSIAVAVGPMRPEASSSPHHAMMLSRGMRRKVYGQMAMQKLYTIAVRVLRRTVGITKIWMRMERAAELARARPICDT